ncbi:hypothetical protein JCM10450v2_006127 [Rhodotorula kratochvilovae]
MPPPAPAPAADARYGLARVNRFGEARRAEIERRRDMFQAQRADVRAAEAERAEQVRRAIYEREDDREKRRKRTKGQD